MDYSLPINAFLLVIMEVNVEMSLSDKNRKKEILNLFLSRFCLVSEYFFENFLKILHFHDFFIEKFSYFDNLHNFKF